MVLAGSIPSMYFNSKNTAIGKYTSEDIKCNRLSYREQKYLFNCLNPRNTGSRNQAILTSLQIIDPNQKIDYHVRSSPRLSSATYLYSNESN